MRRRVLAALDPGGSPVRRNAPLHRPRTELRPGGCLPADAPGLGGSPPSLHIGKPWWASCAAVRSWPCGSPIVSGSRDVRTVEITRTTSDSIDAAKTLLPSVRNARRTGPAPRAGVPHRRHVHVRIRPSAHARPSPRQPDAYVRARPRQGTDPSRITRIVDALRTHGLVTKERHGSDGRGNEIVLTERGHSRLASAQPLIWPALAAASSTTLPCREDVYAQSALQLTGQRPRLITSRLHCTGARQRAVPSAPVELPAGRPSQDTNIPSGSHVARRSSSRRRFSSVTKRYGRLIRFSSASWMPLA